MADEHIHHHHHHRHKEDGATKFKRTSLAAIDRRKAIEKYGKIALFILAVLMGLAVVVAYKFL